MNGVCAAWYSRYMYGNGDANFPHILLGCALVQYYLRWFDSTRMQLATYWQQLFCLARQWASLSHHHASESYRCCTPILCVCWLLTVLRWPTITKTDYPARNDPPPPPQPSQKSCLQSKWIPWLHRWPRPSWNSCLLAEPWPTEINRQVILSA